MRRMRALIMLGVAALIVVVGLVWLAGGFRGVIGERGDPVVDGWVIGVEECNETAGCQDYVDAATAQLGQRDAGHAAIVRTSVHSEGRYYDELGRSILWTRSGGCCLVVRFELADQSIRAIGAGYPGVSQTIMAFDYGPVITMR